jgi:hypothetical protein
MYSAKYSICTALGLIKLQVAYSDTLASEEAADPANTVLLAATQVMQHGCRNVGRKWQQLLLS